MLKTNTNPVINANARRAAFERRESRNRKQQECRQDIIKELQKDNLFMNTVASDVRVEHKRRLRQSGIEELEKETLLAYIEDQEQSKMIQEELRKEEQLVNEMERYHHEQVKEQKLRQLIRENSVELRELEKKLNYAYMNKERFLQLKEKDLIREKAKAEDAAVYALWKAQAEREKLEEIETQKKNQEKAHDYHKALHGQVLENEEKKRQDYEQFLKEKEMIDEIVAKIMLENEKEAKDRMEKQEETKQFIEQFMAEREQWKKEERKRQEEENRKISEYARLQKLREDDVITKKKAIAAGKDAIYDKLALEIEHKEKLKIELEELRISLAQEEQESMARRKEHDMFQNRIRKRLETIDAYHAQIADKKRRLAEEKKDEDIFREKLMQKFAEDDRIEQMKQAQRRMKQLEHRRAVDALIAERHRILKEHEDEEKKLDELEREVSKYKEAVIEQERQRLLREHAAKLAGFLPKGVLRDQADLDLFDEEFKKKFNIRE